MKRSSFHFTPHQVWSTWNKWKPLVQTGPLRPPFISLQHKCRKEVRNTDQKKTATYDTEESKIKGLTSLKYHIYKHFKLFHPLRELVDIKWFGDPWSGIQIYCINSVKRLISSVTLWQIRLTPYGKENPRLKLIGRLQRLKYDAVHENYLIY